LISDGGVPPDTAAVLTIRAYDELSSQKPNILGHAITRVTLEKGGAPLYRDRELSTVTSVSVANGNLVETGKEDSRAQGDQVDNHRGKTSEKNLDRELGQESPPGPQGQSVQKRPRPEEVLQEAWMPVAHPHPGPTRP
jgi:hypothetical protein